MSINSVAASCNSRTTHWEQDGLIIDIAIPGGNLLVESISDGILRVRQDRRDSPDNWFHWSFRLRGEAGRRIEVRFGDGPVVGVRGPAISVDDGRTWRWLDEVATVQRDAFVCTLPAASVRYSMGIPHQPADWEIFASAQPELRRDILCTSRHGRRVELARCGGDATAPWLVLVTARHHCCEAMAGHVVEGLLAAVLADPAWKSLAEVLAIPFVDRDGVEEGDQGKGRHPHDHARDYRADNLYPETGAIRCGLPGWAGGRKIAVLDLHCPGLAGATDQHIYQVGAEKKGIWDVQRQLAAQIELQTRGPLPYHAAGDVPFGTSWNTAANYIAGKSLCLWVVGQPGIALASAFEIPYADVGGVAMLPAAARAFGADLARALAIVLADGQGSAWQQHRLQGDC